MSAELISAQAPSPVGVLADGTVCYAPAGEVVVTGALGGAAGSRQAWAGRRG
jgi:hypothetical protein